MTDIHDFTKIKNMMALLLCAMFFLLCATLTLSGGRLYAQTADASSVNYQSRTALSYLVNQIRQGDRVDGGIAVTSFGGQDAVCIREQLEGCSFLTLLYCYDGQLRELFMEEGTGLQPGDGTPLLPLDGLSVTARDGVMTLTVTLPEQGATRQVSLAPRCGIKEDYGL